MTLHQVKFDSQVDGTTATTGNTGADGVNAAGGTIKFSAAAAHLGQCGLEFTGTSGGSYTVAWWKVATANAQYAVSVVFELPSTPTINATVVQIQSGANAVTRFIYQSTGNAQVWDGTNYNNADTPYTMTAATQYRLAMQLDATAGTIDANLYTADGTTPLATWTLTGLTFTYPTMDTIVLGNNSSIASLTTYIDDLQYDDGRTSEIPGLTATAASTIRPNGVTSAGNWTAVGAADVAVALADQSDSTYAESPAAATGEAFTVDYPTLDSGVVTVKTRAGKDSGAATGILKVELLQTDTVIASDTFTLTGSPTDYQFTTTTAEAANITDRSALRVRHTATIS